MLHFYLTSCNLNSSSIKLKGMIYITANTGFCWHFKYILLLFDPKICKLDWFCTKKIIVKSPTLNNWYNLIQTRLGSPYTLTLNRNPSAKIREDPHTSKNWHTHTEYFSASLALFGWLWKDRVFIISVTICS
jgi:hypothetical protein